ncbi:DNA-binding protein modulo [Drosophila teissieri]|uniref:DNA-binding protein modulo n=1 Tax=Drosophila teissieri TaxID=7243 RepID=UPI001CBA2C23|nr:DNA-binding protein modulo [Drosophila teissieri]
MAQKKAVTAKGKKATNGVEKPLAKRVTKSIKVQEEKETVVAKSPSKKSKKLPVKEVPQSSEEDESDVEEQSDEQAQDDSDFETGEAADLIEDEAEEDEEDDSDEEEDDDDELEPGEVSKSEGADEVENSDDDEAPVEKPVSKKSKNANSEVSEENSGIPKVQTNRIPPGTPQNQILFVTNLPSEYAHKDLVALFAKFGTITALQRFKKINGITVLIAFNTPAAVEAALQAKPKALTLGDNVLSVSQPINKEEGNERTVVVGLFGNNITQDDLKTYFEKVAPVEFVSITAKRSSPKAYVRLVSIDDVPKVLKLNSTELFSRFITVSRLTQKPITRTSENTLVISNVGRHESYSYDALAKILKKFGDVEEIDVLCSKIVLAFVTFKESDAATKALAQLDGKTVNNVEWKVHRYDIGGRSILVTNLTADVTKDDLEKLFNESGEIESIALLGKKALIKFKEVDGFCKSFLANETILKNSPIFIEPSSLLKQKVLRQQRLLATAQARSPRKFQKDFKPNFGKKPFNKRPAHENGSNSFNKRARF